MSYRKWLISIFAILCTLLVLAVAMAIALTPEVKAPGFLARFADATLQVQEKSFGLRGDRCDVLIYGDSTALTGVDPRVIRAETGLKACNIATTRPIIDSVGMLPVDDFLAHNPKPKILVLQFGPEVFFRGKPWDGLGGIAPLALLLRQRPGWHTVWTMILHPDVTARFYVAVLQNRVLPKKAEVARFKVFYKKGFDDYEASGGRLPYLEPAETNCNYPADKLNGPLATGWVESLRKKYQDQGIAVLVKASPLPTCDPQLGFFEQAVKPVVDSNIVAMPVDNFVPGNRHMTFEGAQTETRALAKLIESRMGR